MTKLENGGIRLLNKDGIRWNQFGISVCIYIIIYIYKSEGYGYILLAENKPSCDILCSALGGVQTCLLGTIGM